MSLCLNIILIINLLIIIAFFTLAERKIMASVQRRKGPNVVGFIGILQPFADGLKLFLKEIIIPAKANMFVFLFSPIITFTLSLLNWSVIPFAFDSVLINLNYSILFLFGISSLSVFGIILAGWSSNSRYALLGALRSSAQMISYEIIIGLILTTIFLLVNSTNLLDVIVIQKHTVFFCFPLLPVTIIFFVCMLAETNRAPFDLPEAEAELVAGYNVEYSGISFALFFLAEYGNILLISTLYVILFFGGWLGFSVTSSFILEIIFGIKVMLICFLFILVRAAFPRCRYDQLMDLCWKYFLPTTLIFYFFVTTLFLTFQYTPFAF